VGKKGVIKNHHAIIHTGKAPSPKSKEKPAKGELEMRSPIRVKATRKSDRLDEMSRINYAKIYTVEHNVKVYDFGQVHSEDEWILTSNFNDVWFSGKEKGAPPAANLTMASTAEESEESEEEEDEEDEDEEEDEEEND
jgi:hypothetical protein